MFKTVYGFRKLFTRVVFTECLIERLVCAYEVGNQEEMTAVSQQNEAQDQTNKGRLANSRFRRGGAAARGVELVPFVYL